MEGGKGRKEERVIRKKWESDGRREEKGGKGCL